MRLWPGSVAHFLRHPLELFEWELLGWTKDFLIVLQYFHVQNVKKMMGIEKYPSKKRARQKTQMVGN